MIYQNLFARAESGRSIAAGVIGTGQYATAIVTQAASIPRLTVPVIADIDVEAARQACQRARVPADQIVVCDSRRAALRALEEGRVVVLADPLLMMDLPLDVIVEATGSAEAGANYALEAIRQGKHVVMVNKETDVTVGPMLKHLATQNNVVYTAADGDQHGLLMGLVTWARELGLEVVCGGKARDADIQYDEATRTLLGNRGELPLAPASAAAFQPIGDGGGAERRAERGSGRRAGGSTKAVALRAAALGDSARVRRDDVMELTIVANATGLRPDAEILRAPILRTIEIPEVLCPIDEGGILQTRGAIEMAICLRGQNDPGMGGGVFIVVECANDYSREILYGKGLVSNRSGTAGLVYRPYHLCGVETPISILCAGLLGVPTGTDEYVPRYDLVARAARDIKKGEIIDDTADAQSLEAIMVPAHPIGKGIPLPMQMIERNPLNVDVAEGNIINADMVTQKNDGSVLWSLRQQQDGQFSQLYQGHIPDESPRAPSQR